jgi:phage N-6-adenine-methyltransferase
MNTDLHFSSQTDLWSTPQDFFDKLNAEFVFQVDVCATSENAKCPKFFTKEQDALSKDWAGICWMNPPYGRAIKHWVKKAYESSLDGATIVCLLPARTDTAWWHDYVIKGEVRFIRGRLKFGGHKNSAPFPSAVVVFMGKSII